MNDIVPYIKTLGTENFRNFLSTSFHYRMLFNVDNNSKYIKIFDKWDIVSSDKKIFKTNDNIKIQFCDDYYFISVDIKQYTLPIPETINDFINDMFRLNIKIYWSKWVDENFEPKDYLPQYLIKEYYRELLNDMNKGYELNLDE